MPVAEHIRPMSVGDMLDLALKLYRAHFKPLFAVMLVIQLPMYAVQAVLESVMRQGLPDTFEPGRLPTLDPDVAIAVLILSPVTFGAIFYLYGLARGALFVAGDAAWRERPVSFGSAFSGLRPRLAALLGTYTLVLLGFGLGLLLAMAPGFGLVIYAGLNASVVLAIVGLVVAGLGGLLVWLFLYLRWYLVLQITMLEPVSGLAAFRRSASLMAGRVADGFLGLVKIRASLLLFVLFFILLVPSALLGVPQAILAAAYTPDGMLPQTVLIPLPIRLPLVMAQITVSAAVGPFSVLASLLFYVDLRIRREGLDLELRAEALGGAAPDPTDEASA